VPFIADGYRTRWPQTLSVLDKLSFNSIIPGQGEVRPKSHLTFFRGYFIDLIAAVKKASADGATSGDEEQVGDQLRRSTKAAFPSTQSAATGPVGTNVEAVYQRSSRRRSAPASGPCPCRHPSGAAKPQRTFEPRAVDRAIRCAPAVLEQAFGMNSNSATSFLNRTDTRPP